MTFTVLGTLDDRSVAVTWKDGELSGDQDAVARAETLVDLRERLDMTPTGPEVIAALEPDWIAARTIIAALDRVDEIIGDVSDPPYVTATCPPGTVF